MLLAELAKRVVWTELLYILLSVHGESEQFGKVCRDLPARGSDLALTSIQVQSFFDNPKYPQSRS